MRFSLNYGSAAQSGVGEVGSSLVTMSAMEIFCHFDSQPRTSAPGHCSARLAGLLKEEAGGRPNNQHSTSTTRAQA